MSNNEYVTQERFGSTFFWDSEARPIDYGRPTSAMEDVGYYYQAADGNWYRAYTETERASQVEAAAGIEGDAYANMHGYLQSVPNYNMHEQTARMEEARAEQARMYEVQRQAAQRQAAENLAQFIRIMDTPRDISFYKDRTQEIMDKFPETTEY